MPDRRFPKVTLPHLFGSKYPHPHTAEEALERLLAGNARFVEGRALRPHGSARRREALSAGQHPFAAVVACADSREAPELLFDCGLGDLFVVRTAGHVAGYTALGSLEFGTLHLGIPLVLVLGHSRCGAVGAAIHVQEGGEPVPGQLGRLIEQITPSVRQAREQGHGLTPEAFADLATRLHVERTVQTIRDNELLAPLLGAGQLKVCGGLYDLASGKVELLGG